MTESNNAAESTTSTTINRQRIPNIGSLASSPRHFCASTSRKKRMQLRCTFSHDSGRFERSESILGSNFMELSSQIMSCRPLAGLPLLLTHSAFAFATASSCQQRTRNASDAAALCGSYAVSVDTCDCVYGRKARSCLLTGVVLNFNPVIY